MRGEDAIRQNLLLDHPRPKYPSNALLYRLTGKGIFELSFDYETGQLREIHIVKSTGHRSLDASIIDALRKWRAKPHGLRVISVPIAFEISGEPSPK